MRRLMKDGRPRQIGIAVVLLVAVVIGTGCTRPGAAPAEEAGLRPMTFMAGYKPQANLPFVAAYVANDRGYFAQQGLAVDVQHSTGQGEHLKLLLQGAVDVTTADADAVLKRQAEQDLPIVAFALFGQRGSQAYAVLEDSDIRSPKDFEGKTVGYKLYQTPDYLAMLERAGADRSKIDEVSVGFDPRILVERRVDVYPVFTSNEPDLLNRIGFPARLFDPADYGVATLGLTYLTRRDLVEQQPEVLARFLKATLRGATDALSDPEAATDVVMRYAPQEERPHQLAMLKSELEMAAGPVTDRLGLGWATREQWQELQTSLLQHGGLVRSVDAENAFTDQILRRVYRGRALVWP
jgi:ABC-type nitrate/sulfonate/bicarbonate transport system substrate-binding protein